MITARFSYIIKTKNNEVADRGTVYQNELYSGENYEHLPDNGNYPLINDGYSVKTIADIGLELGIKNNGNTSLLSDWMSFDDNHDIIYGLTFGGSIKPTSYNRLMRLFPSN